MQLQRAVVLFNSHDWEVDGIPAKTFGGEISFSGPLGEIKVRMKPSVVESILDLVADEVSEAIQEMARKVTPGVVRSGGLAIEHKPEISF